MFLYHAYYLVLLYILNLNMYYETYYPYNIFLTYHKYGVDNYAKTEDNKKESRERYWKLHDQIVEKRKLTNIERYGVENCFQSE